MQDETISIRGLKRGKLPWALALGSLAVLAQLWLVWGFPYFPTVDGPAHTHLAHAIYEALRGDAYYGALVELNSRLNPNMLTQAILVSLMAVSSPVVAEKLLLTIYFVSYALSASYALMGINRQGLYLLPALLFCSFSFPLAFGFYNFAFSTVVFLAWFGFWWRHRDSFTMRVVLAHALFAAIAYATHIFAFIVTLAAIGATGLTAALVRASLTKSVKGHASVVRPLLTHGLPPLLGSIPELIACIFFLFGRFGSLTIEGAASLETNLLYRLQIFLLGNSFAPYSNTELITSSLFVLVALGVALLLQVKSKDPKRSLPFAICFGAFLLLYMFMPSEWIVRWMPLRFQPIVAVAMLLWLTSLIPADLKPSHGKSIGVLCLALVLLSLAIRIPLFSNLNSYYRELASTAPYIPEKSSLISLRLHSVPANLDVLIQAGSRIADLRNSVDLKNFQGQSDDHPIQFRPGISATAALGGDAALTSLSPDINLMAYEQQTGRPIDYVLIYGFPRFVIDPAGLESLQRQLEANYRLVQTSKPGGFARLYVRDTTTTMAGKTVMPTMNLDSASLPATGLDSP